MLSVIIPVYNGEKYLRVSLDSVLAQSLAELEIIIVNDGSKDGSQKIIDEYAARDSRILAIVQENQGAAAARNKGLDIARGDHVLFFDCDDILQPGALEKLYKKALQTDADLVIGNYRYLHEATGQIETPAQWVGDQEYVGEATIACCHLTCLLATKVWKRSMLEKYGLRMLKMKLGEDLSFFLKGLARCEKVVTTDVCVYHYRIYDGSTSYSYDMRSADFIGAFNHIESDYRQLGGREAFIRELMYDRMFYYVGTLKRLPRYRSKADRKALLDAYIRAVAELDFSPYTQRKDVMDLVVRFRRFEKYRKLYESELYTQAYRIGRKVKHGIRKWKHGGKRG